jgi:antitoxin component YwqK of YwqJK toxin-antitoxin module
MPMAKQVQVRVSRIDFFRLHGDEFFEMLFHCVERELGEGRQRARRWAGLTPHQQGVYAWWSFQCDVLNGGLTQFFYNHTDAIVPPLERLLQDSGNAPLAAHLKQATKTYRSHRKEFAVDNPFGADGLFARMTELSELDRPVGRLLGRTSRQLEKWLRANISGVAVGDSGEPIDPKFTGEIETRHPNGLVFEQATIRRGVLSGPYRRYLDDGTLEHTCFYKGGKVSTDYWPNGQPRHKTLKRGKLKVDEWYYPSGNVQKRYVADKTGFAVEPIRLWHENGQLAEEVHTRQGDKLGPWLRFFEDGSPRLQAEHRRGEKLVVKNAWDDEGRQVVTNGSGTYFDDGMKIDISYDLLFRSDWTSAQELKDGIPHGAGTTWLEGILWSNQEYVDGKLHGTETLYYDNGRVRTRTTWRHGRMIKTEDFPKFDNPRPAVLLRTEATVELYKAWGHPLLDAHPEPRNLEKLEARLKMPEFLKEVFERNQSGSLDDDYEDLNTFDDSIAYMVMVNERGAVDSVEFSGASVYSGSMIDEYPRIIQRLKYTQGRIGKRKVRCRVVVWVHHTFVEDGPIR